ncbi:MAG: DUF4352 domain-containing protein [Thermoanaerobacter sp.]|uniref:DUF4352 domain-containing protein n=1 Tax=Thermoanaerobacter sp. TaxID=1755 RepID=UPI0034641285
MSNKQKKPIFKKWWFWLIVIIVIGAIASAGGEDKPRKEEPAVTTGEQTQGQPQEQTQERTQEQGQAAEQPKEETPEFFKIGETAVTKKVKATITEMEKSEGDEFNKPADGHEFVLLHMTIENVSDQEIVVSSMLSFNAYVDDNAINENLAAQISKDGAKTMDGTIAAGKKLTGTLAYEVPKDWKKLEIHFKSDQFSDTTIKWLIENK